MEIVGAILFIAACCGCAVLWGAILAEALSD